MKAFNLINDALSEWRAVRSAPDLAHELFDQLDPAEVERLAVAGFAAEIRKALTKKVKGLPQYSNVEVIDSVTGKKTKRYKNTELFNADDYRVAVDSYMKRSRSNFDIAKALADAAAAKLGIQLTLSVRAS